MARLPSIWRLQGSFESLKLPNCFFSSPSVLTRIWIALEMDIHGQQLELLQQLLQILILHRLISTPFPIWVHLPDSPLSSSANHFPGDYIPLGVFIRLDKVDQDSERKTSSAQILVETDLSNPLWSVLIFNFATTRDNRVFISEISL